MSLSSRLEFITSKHFLLRVLSSVFLIAFALLLSWYGGLPFIIVWAVVGIIVAFEWWSIVKGGSAFWLPLGIIYACCAALGPILIRYEPTMGFQALMWAFAIIWTTDIMAYLFGRTLGGPKLWPRVSPNKTWSGFLGGVASGALIGAILAYCWIDVPSLVPVALLAVFAALLTQGGDLLESAVKRRFDVKDSGCLIPGHGGFMDRLDGCIVACALLAAVGWLHAGAENVAQGILIW